VTADAPRVFIVVATGQPVANLPPILAYGQPGLDGILWLLSAKAKEYGYAHSSIEVLKARGFADHQPLEVSDHPGELAEALREWLGANPALRPVLVGNGGTKLGGLGLADALANRDHCVVYGDGQPCRLWIKESPAADWTWRPYAEATLSLTEILTLTGNVIENPSAARRFWPDLADWPTDSFGEAPEPTAAAHDEFDLYDAAKRALARPPPRYREAAALAPAEMAGWREAVINLGRRIRNLLNAGRNLDGLELAATFNKAADLARRAERQAELLAARPGERIGPRFERATARRVRAWLTIKPRRPIIEAWENVLVRKTAPAGATKPNASIDMDVTLVLTNGVLLNLECKSFESDAKDLTARLLNLQTVGSRLADMYVCAPVYTDCVDRPWFQKIAEMRRVVSDTTLKFIAFTLPGQPPTWIDSAGKEHPCPSFEAALDAAIAPYRP